MVDTIDIVEQLAQRLDHFISESTKCTQSLRDAKVTLDELRHAKEHQCILELKRLREDFDILVQHLEKLGVPKLNMEAEKLEKLKLLLNDPAWPAAISPDYIVETIEGKQVRAKQILDLVVTEPLKGLKFLDYGCGEGFVTIEAMAAHRETAAAIGYDIEKQWDDDVSNMTTDFKKVLKNAPYDIVLLYDVLDHCEKPIGDLCHIRELLSIRGRVYVRMHPWCSKHGGNIYRIINKSHVHVIFDDAEQLSLFGECPFVQKVTNPVSVYRNWIMTSGFDIIQESIIRDPELDPFFTNIDNIHIQERITNHWSGVDYLKDLTTNFVNYVLEPTQSHKQVL